MPTHEPLPLSPSHVFREAESGEPYGRTLLPSADDACELLAMRWRPGARCAPHDHGSSAGTIHLVEGRFVERRFRFDGAALHVIAEETHEAPALLHIEANVIHDMVAPTGGLSIHRYTTAIRGMRVWDVSGQNVLVVTDDCGAWIPSDETMIRSSTPWNELQRSESP